MQWVEEKCFSDILQCKGQSPAAKNYPAQKVNSAGVEQPWPRATRNRSKGVGGS